MTDPQEEQQIREGKFFAAISYIFFLCIITLILKKDNKFALYHAKHGLVLFVIETAALILSIIPFLSLLIWVFGYTLFLLVSVWGIMQSVLGIYSRIPVLTDISEKVIL